MNNKEYKEARDIAESAGELYTFESYNGGFYPTRYMKPDDLKEMRQNNKVAKETLKAFVLDGFGNRALVIPTETGYLLQSYYTVVAEVKNGEFIKRWGGFSTTTLKHINIFREFIGLDKLSKREWIELSAA